MIFFPSASHEEFRLGFSTVPAAPPMVSADPCVVAVSERHGLSCFFGFINDEKKENGLRNLIRYQRGTGRHHKNW